MDIKDVENLATLSKIDLSPEEKNQILKDMRGILSYVEQIESVEVPETKPAYKLFNIWREDKTEPRKFSIELIKKQFPDSEGNFLKVKKIL